MPYPDIKDSKVSEEMTFIHVLPEILLVVTAPVWVTVLLVWGFEDFWFSVGISILLTIGVGCLIAGFLPQSASKQLRKMIVLRPEKKTGR